MKKNRMAYNKRELVSYRIKEKRFMMDGYHDDHSSKEEYSTEIHPGSRQDVRKEEGHTFSPLLIGLCIIAFVLLLFLFK
ncbi:hypothetical protein ACFDTO_23445 [Microbacteriaceae bacterium 4G12]